MMNDRRAKMYGCSCWGNYRGRRSNNYAIDVYDFIDVNNVRKYLLNNGFNGVAIGVIRADIEREGEEIAVRLAQVSKCATITVTPTTPSVTINDFYTCYRSSGTKRTTIKCGETDLGFKFEVSICYLSYLTKIEIKAGKDVNSLITWHQISGQLPTCSGSDYGCGSCGITVSKNANGDNVSDFLSAVGVNCSDTSVYVCGYLYW